MRAWLGHVGLSRYANILEQNGITQVYQIPGVTENVSVLVMGAINCKYYNVILSSF